ncbi:hypothetical protein [Runella zeae]|uniref:hypothetical protein n=1 Tax=Runella zeae TaxID=94255 RepID=UPI002354614D|nr:hypothetical protein [Runella zeae]
MKKFLGLILVSMLTSIASFAQFQISKFESSSTAKDTIRVYATQNRTMQLQLGGYYDAVTVTSNIDRVGATTLAGTYKLQKRLHSAAGWTDVASMTYTVTNTTAQSVTWDLPAGIYGELQIHYTGSGSGTGTAKAWASVFKRK